MATIGITISVSSKIPHLPEVPEKNILFKFYDAP